MVFLPLILAFAYNKIGTSSIDAYFLPINLVFAVVTAYVQCCLIAEEKEKNTLRNLMLSPASLADILIGKSLFVFIVTIVVVSLAIFLVGYEPANLLILAIALLLSTVFYIALGTLCGLFAKTIMEASIIVMPVSVYFLLRTVCPITGFCLPNLRIGEMATKLTASAISRSFRLYTMMDCIIPIVTITVWSLLTWGITGFIYKKLN
ncbi:ABC transporter OS=Lysinibacillus sphaericus OX=1421 GN=LS41612_21490 PE=4 SV=1 [Lysinibacillus sphaericus]